VLEESPSVILCYTNAIIIDEQGRCLREYADGCNLRSASPYERFRHALLNFRLSNPMFGVVRADVLKMTRLLGSYVAADVVLVAELALLGELYQIPDRLFLRRDHPQKSNRANPTVHDRAVLYDPANRGRIQLRTWRVLVEQFASIRRSRMNRREKLRCYLFVGKCIRWGAGDLSSELMVAARHLVGGSKCGGV
jgi:hypothetical protein